jgi:peptidoglycan hydrolase-like protein with peptidoglycan-binding domain
MTLTPAELTFLNGGPATPTLSGITRDLTVGSSGSDVSALQAFLISQAKGPAASALGAAGATGYFGSLTQAALAEYQKAVGITPASGYFGPITRAYLNGGTTPTLLTLSGITRDLTIGSRGSDVSTLQAFLIAQAKGTAAGALSSAGVTGYFGSLTQAALAEYQTAAGITPASGYFGPITRAYLKNAGF